MASHVVRVSLAMHLVIGECDMKRFAWWRMEQDTHHLSRALCGAFCSILHHVKRFMSQPPVVFFMARFRCDLCGESCDLDGKLKYSAVSRPRTIFVTSHICSFVAEFFLHCVCAKTTTHFDVFFSLSLGLLEKKGSTLLLSSTTTTECCCG